VAHSSVHRHTSLRQGQYCEPGYSLLTRGPARALPTEVHPLAEKAQAQPSITATNETLVENSSANSTIFNSAYDFHTHKPSADPPLGTVATYRH